MTATMSVGAGAAMLMRIPRLVTYSGGVFRHASRTVIVSGDLMGRMIRCVAALDSAQMDSYVRGRRSMGIHVRANRNVQVAIARRINVGAKKTKVHGALSFLYLS